jgi:hypothetical protein
MRIHTKEDVCGWQKEHDETGRVNTMTRAFNRDSVTKIPLWDFDTRANDRNRYNMGTLVFEAIYPAGLRVIQIGNVASVSTKQVATLIFIHRAIATDTMAHGQTAYVFPLGRQYC